MRRRWIGAMILVCHAQAATITVDTTSDTTNDVDGLTSLREAVIWANENGGSDTIEIPAGLYVRTIAGGGEDNARTGDLDIRDSLIVHGAGATNTIIDAAGLDRVMFFDHDLQVTISDLTLSGGSAFDGGGIYNESTAHVVRCIMEGNEAGYGGGVENYGGTLYVENSTIRSNTAFATLFGGAGGVDVVGGSVILSNSTISGNYSHDRGGGLNRDGGTLSLFSCTVAFNGAAHNSGGAFGRPNATMGDMANTIIAENMSPETPDLSAPVNSLGYNLIGVSTGAGGFGATDLLGTNALLGLLQDNGGPTFTHALLAGSPAINRADPGQEPTFDQRGLPRPRGRAPDIGALEEQSPDEDLDGVPDEWEMGNGLNPTNALDAADDPDLDGFNNRDEFFADTDPTNTLSFHRITGFLRAFGLVYVTFPSSTNRLYNMEATTNGLDGTWNILYPMLPGATGGTMTFISLSTSTRRAYRVNVRPP